MRHKYLSFKVEAALRARDENRREVPRYWTERDISTLVRLADAQATTRQIALELGRSQLAVRLKASRMGVSLTAHEVRRSARRHARRQGAVALAEATQLRQRPRIAITVDFDLSSLTRGERQQLAERLRVMEAEEMEPTPPGATVPPPEPVIPMRRKRKLHKAYDPSATTAQRNRDAAARHRESRAALGWKRTNLPEDHPLRVAAEARQALRRLNRQLERERKANNRAPVRGADALDSRRGPGMLRTYDDGIDRSGWDD